MTGDRIVAERDADYGNPTPNHERIAAVWTTLLHQRLAPGSQLTAADVALLMAALKIVRETHRPKADNLIDAHGYLTIYTHIIGEQP